MLGPRVVAACLGACLTVGVAGCGGGRPSSSVANRAPAPAADAGDPDALPAEVQALIDRWESCQHWSGEEPYDRERARAIAAAIEDTCPGNDEIRAALLERYADRPAIVERLRALAE